ncbi:MAG: sigma-70 family RNA polymerase sigma factor [Archangium sp.]|nr:sigma-70 family RNA polymerase sigma factor [Archangium sp.]MDP3569344.1 sigma-70 family RNA polymerase sigma factor [Archangium sp.]
MNSPSPISAEEALAHTEWVGRLARALVDTREEAADLAQDAWEAALDTTERPQSELRAWLTGVLRNLSAMRARTNTRRTRRELATEDPQPPLPPDELIARLETQQLVAKLVLELDEPLRMVLFLRYYEGLSSAEIGGRLGIPAGTVRWRLKAGVDELRVQLDHSFGGDRQQWMGLVLPALAAPTAGSEFLKGALFMKANKVVVGMVGALLSLFLIGAWWLWPSPESPRLTTGGPSAMRAIEPSTPRLGALSLTASPTLDAEREQLPGWLSQPDVPPRHVAGRVLMGGQPMAGALVRLEPRPLPVGVRAKELRSAGDGTFDFGEQPAAIHIVSASAPGRTGALVEVDLRDPSASPPPDALELVLTSCDARLVGHVFDSSGGPIEHARLRRTNSIGVETNARGEFELCLPPGPNALHADAPGYGTVQLTVLALGRTARDVVLTPEAFIVGKVVSAETGAPVSAALLSAFPGQYLGTDSVLGGMALSGPDGRFLIPVAPGDYRVRASAPNAESPSAVLVTAIVGRLSDEVVLRVRELTTLRGHVRSEGKPIAGAQVVAIATSGGQRADGFSQRDGSFTLTRVPRGQVTFTAAPFAVFSPGRVSLTKVEETVELEVKRQGSLRGLVTRAGKPVAGAKIQVTSGVIEFNATSDLTGHYAVLGLPGGRFRVLASSVTAGGFVDREGVVLAEREDRALDLELSNAASIAGQVVNAEGTPVAGAVVVFTHTKTGDEGKWVTDADGRFLCNQMTGGGEYQPQVFPTETSRTPYSPAGAPFSATHLVDGNAHVEGVTLAIKYERLQISGRVVDPDGVPIPDAKIRAQSAPPGETLAWKSWVVLPSAISDAQGGFTLDALTSGPWALQARAPDGSEAVVNGVAAGSKEVVVTLRPAGGIEGTLVGYEAPPAIYARSIDTLRMIPGQVDGARFHLKLPAGSYLVSAMNVAEGDVQRVEVREGAITKVTMTSHGKAVITGRVTDHLTHAPIPDLICQTVIAVEGQGGVTNWDLESAPKTDATGTFVADPSPAGDLFVGCFGDWREYSKASALITVAKGGRATVNLEAVKLISPDAPGDIGVSFGDTATPLIRAVKAGSPAARAGVAAGDVVVAVDGLPTAPLDASGVEALIGNHAPGSRVAMTLLRGTQRREVTLTTTALGR